MTIAAHRVVGTSTSVVGVVSSALSLSGVSVRAGWASPRKACQSTTIEEGRRD